VQDFQQHRSGLNDAETSEIRQVAPGIRRQIAAYGSDLMPCRVWFDEGAVGDVHSHPHSQATYIESGRFRIVIAGKERELGPGEAIHLPPHCPHGAVCLESGALLDAFSPARADFLQEEG